MPDQDDLAEDRLGGEGRLDRLDDRLKAFDAKRKPQPSLLSEGAGAGQGYRLLAVIISGILGGLGLGWIVDQVAHTSPFGLIGGLLIGTVGSIVSAVVTAQAMSRTADAEAGRKASPPPAADNEN